MFVIGVHDKTITQLQHVDPYDYEELVAAVWNEEGYDTRVFRGSSDGGVDVVAERDGPVGHKTVIQAKQYSDGNQVGPQRIREYAGVRQREIDADSIVFVTSSGFTSNAEREAEELNVKLVSGPELAEMIEEADADSLTSTLGRDGDRQRGGDERGSGDNDHKLGGEHLVRLVPVGWDRVSRVSCRTHAGSSIVGGVGDLPKRRLVDLYACLYRLSDSGVSRRLGAAQDRRFDETESVDVADWGSLSLGSFRTTISTSLFSLLRTRRRLLSSQTRTETPSSRSNHIDKYAYQRHRRHNANSPARYAPCIQHSTSDSHPEIGSAHAEYRQLGITDRDSLQSLHKDHNGYSFRCHREFPGSTDDALLSELLLV